MKKIDISFITINYNSSNHTIALVESIAQKVSSTLSYEIIVVDNASGEDDFLNLERSLNDFACSTLVRNRINTGFAGGNMLGVNYASGEYYFFINNDCILINDVAIIMKSFMDTHNTAGVVTAKIMDETGYYSSSFKQFPSVLKQLFGNSIERLISLKHFPSNKTLLIVPTAVEVISGSCMFFRADDFCAIGGFDTAFFLYCEEEDICKRVWSSGKQIFFVPEAEIFHKVGGSSIQNIALKKEFYISYNLLINKHFTFFSRFLIKGGLFFKQFRRVFTKQDSLQIFLFVVSGSPIKDSLRYIQKIYKR